MAKDSEVEISEVDDLIWPEFKSINYPAANIIFSTGSTQNMVRNDYL